MKKKTKRSVRSFLDEKVLLFVVFITGACVLILEVVATRILSPYFGNTIFTVSSVIGVILGALSFGYYWGGKYADKNPYTKNFFQIILFGGFTTLFLQFLVSNVLPVFAYNLSFVTGPVVISLIFFTLPSFLLGSLSPYAIKLREVHFPKEGIGKLSGEVFFASTLGSIFGTFLTGFYLIPSFGIDKIVLGVGLVLILIGLTGLQIQKKSKIFVLKTILVSSALISFSFGVTAKGVIYSKDGLYEKITVYDSKLDGKRTRFLYLDRSAASARFLDSDELVFDYTKYYALYKLFNKKPERALFLGGGAYSTPKILLNEVSNIKIDIAEVEPRLYELSKIYFGLSDDLRLQNHVKDGRRFLHDTENEYDIIFSDVYTSIYSIPTHFTTYEFFELAKQKLTPNGIFFANIIGDLLPRSDSLILSEIRTFQKVFPNSLFFAVDSPEISKSQNIIFTGVNNDGPLVVGKMDWASVENESLKNISQKIIDLEQFDLSNYPVLTDNYAPVEKLSAELIRRLPKKGRMGGRL